MSIFTKEEIKALVSSAFERKQTEMVNEFMTEWEATDVDETLDEETDEKEKEDGDDDEDESEEEDEESELEESLKVAATLADGKKRNGHKQVILPKVKNMKDLNKAAKTGEYEYFVVTKKNGETMEFHVEKGKLVEM